jgi:putative two-component system response regulator
METFMPIRPILVVDDEASNLALLRKILEPEYKLVFARNGPEALAAVSKHHPALILLDIQMPGMNGYQVCETLQKDPMTKDIPVIFVTSLSDSGNEELGFNAGCVDYLSKPLVHSIVKARVKTHLSLVQTQRLEKNLRSAIFMLGQAGHYNDNNTGVHIWRMANYSKLLGKAMGYSMPEAEMIEFAAPMHDTGKIGIPDSVLCKPGPLNDEEWCIMRTHCRIGYEILSKNDETVFRIASEIALHHHEKWDGSGYPNGLSGKDIPESARIVAITDVFDALTMARPYKEPWPIEKSFTHIQDGAGQHFDPKIVDCFLSIRSEILAAKDEWHEIEQSNKK